jgi:hypothetical protein
MAWLREKSPKLEGFALTSYFSGHLKMIDGRTQGSPLQHVISLL